MISSSLTLILLLVGGQTAVFVPDPPGGPGREFVFPIGDGEPGGGGGGSCGCKGICDLAIIMSDGKGGEVRCDFVGCRMQGFGLYKVLVCRFKNPINNAIEERSAGSC
ncbi:MAG: hypothetical protein LBQ86_02640 [Holophagales bacterium]|jgi:hypothetical protein|nr:hypothetical protein [Holophagales bacterium]